VIRASSAHLKALKGQTGHSIFTKRTLPLNNKEGDRKRIGTFAENKLEVELRGRFACSPPYPWGETSNHGAARWKGGLDFFGKQEGMDDRPIKPRADYLNKVIFSIPYNKLGGHP
jgi:hypothetical protein